MTAQDTLTQDVRAKAQELRREARDAIHNEANRAATNLRDSAVDQISNVADAAAAASAEFDAGSLQARAVEQVANQVEVLANNLRTKNLNTLTRDVSNFARQNPALFIGGAALLGFAATRFLKARDAQYVAQGFGEADPWNSRASMRPVTGGTDVPS